MKNWTETLTLAALAVLFTLPLAGCAEDAPAASMTEAEPEAFDRETIYQCDPSCFGVFLQFDSEEAKRVFAKFWALQGVTIHLEPLSAERAAQVRDNDRPVHVLGVCGSGCWVTGSGFRVIRSYNFDPEALVRGRPGSGYHPVRAAAQQPREEVRR